MMTFKPKKYNSYFLNFVNINENIIQCSVLGKSTLDFVVGFRIGLKSPKSRNFNYKLQILYFFLLKEIHNNLFNKPVSNKAYIK